MKLRQRIFTSALWTVGTYGAELITRLISNLIMTRLLFPEAFGMVAASTSIIIGLVLLTDFGIRAVIIQSARGEDPEFLRSAWVFQTSRGIIVWLALVMVCSALSLPPIRDMFSANSVFANKSFPLLTIVLGIGVVLSGLESTAVALNIRRLNYRSVAIVDLVGKIIPVPIMVVCALVVPSVWALAVGALAGSLVRTVLSHVMVPGPRMALRWDKDHIREIVHFGKWITVSSIGGFIGSQSDVIILGLLFPSAGLGIYFIAKSLVDAVEGLLERLNSSLTLSVLGEVIRKNPDNLRDRYYRFRFPIEVVAALAAGVIFTTSGQIVGLLYDSRYHDAGPMLQILSLSLAIYPFQLIRSAFTAIGKPRIVALLSLVQAASLALLLTSGYFMFGPLGAIAGIAASRLLPSALFLFFAHGHKWINFWYELRTLAIFAIGMMIGELAELLLKMT